MSSSPTKNQITFIGKLIEESPERESKKQEFLSKLGKESIEELSVQEASKLIESLKSMEVKGNSEKGNSDPMATGKQISFLTSLQSSESRISAAREYLSKVGKPSINLLSMQEASELIERLKSIEVPRGTDTSQAPVTQKQVRYIMSLASSDEKKKIAELFLKKINKKEFEELTRKEASQLIDLLK